MTGDVQAGLMHSIPTSGSTPAERLLALSIAGAHKTLYITNSYFVPGENFLQLLLKAAKRGGHRPWMSGRSVIGRF